MQAETRPRLTVSVVGFLPNGPLILLAAPEDHTVMRIVAKRPSKTASRLGSP